MSETAVSVASALERLFGLEGKVSLVTGAGKGIGRSAAIGLAEAGSDIALVARTEGDLVEVAGGIRGLGRRALVLPADLTDLASVPTLVDRVVAEFGHIDVLVNNAGVSIRNDVIDASVDEWDYITDLNLKSMFLLSQAAIRHMAAQNSGKIINVTSITSIRGNPGSAIYCMTKGGLLQFTRSFAVELARKGIDVQVNCVAPGTFRTPQAAAIDDDQSGKGIAFREFLNSRVPMGRMGEPDELKGAFILLASAASAYITGESIFVDGGWTACA
jgi:NAD(P)-dependent dehydrogenase (short-subunit alcohol dehydrogenase family)